MTNLDLVTNFLVEDAVRAFSSSWSLVQLCCVHHALTLKH